MRASYGFLAGIPVLAIGLACSAGANAASDWMQVNYITGGVGEDEQQAMQAAAGQYDLQVTNAEPDGAYTAGTDVVVTDREGNEVLDARNTGPLLYAQLPPGRYVLRATYEGIEHQRDVAVSPHHPARVTLIWPEE